MRVDLGTIQAVHTELALPGTDQGPPRQLRLQECVGLSGMLEKSDAVLTLSNVCAEKLVADAAEWHFGSVGLTATGASAFRDVRLKLTSSDAPMELDLGVEHVEFARLEIRVGQVAVRAHAQMEHASLEMGDGLGSIRAKHVMLQQFELQLGALQLRCPELGAHQLDLSWGGPEGFQMRVETAQGDRVQVALEGLTVQATPVHLRGFELKGGALFALALETQDLSAELLWPEHPNSPASAAPPTPADAGAESPRVFDPRTLDALKGHLGCDARLDVRLPGGLHRKLSLPLSLDVLDGCIDYSALEHSLPTLEDSLFDFSTRDEGWLTLELGIPLLPTRGFGKGLVRWPLDAQDRDLARDHRVRLSALPDYELCVGGSRASEAPPKAKSTRESSTRLEEALLSLNDIRLSLPPPARHLHGAISLLAFERASLGGALAYHHAQSKQGEVTAHLQALQLRLSELGVGERVLSLDLRCAEVPQARIETAGFKPRTLKLSAENLRLHAVDFR